MKNNEAANNKEIFQLIEQSLTGYPRKVIYKRKKEVCVCEKLNCSPLSAMKMKQRVSGRKEKSKHSHYSKKQAEKATSDLILLNTKGSTCYLSTTRELQE